MLNVEHKTFINTTLYNIFVCFSTLSSGINSVSAVTIQDLVRHLCFPDMTEARATLTSKILSIVYGSLCILLTFVAAELGGVLQVSNHTKYFCHK